MLRTTIFEGKQYPRPDDDNFMFASEAAARLRTSSYEGRVMYDYNVSPPVKTGSIVRFEVNRYGEHASEGRESRNLPAIEEVRGRGTNLARSVYALAKTDVCELCIEYGFMTAGESRRLLTEGKKAEAEADLQSKVEKAAELRVAALAAAFALELAKDDEEGRDSLCAHWRSQEHAYILAEEEVRKAKQELARYD